MLIHWWHIKDWFDPQEGWSVYQYGTSLIVESPNSGPPVVLPFNDGGLALLMDVWETIDQHYPEVAISLKRELEDLCEDYEVTTVSSRQGS